MALNPELTEARLAKRRPCPRENLQAADAWRRYTEQKNSILGFISSQLNNEALRKYKLRMNVLKKCSYYLEVLRKDFPHGDHSYVTSSTIFHLIDPWRFQRMKRIGTSQVKIQLCLLDEFYEQMRSGKEELEGIMKTYDLSAFLSESSVLQHKLSQISRALFNFNSVIIPGRLHMKHRLISDMGNGKNPQVGLAVTVKMPVVFDKEQSVAFQDSIRLKWGVAGQAEHNPTEKFEIRYKLLKPETKEEGNQYGTLTVDTCCTEINRLLPDKTYECAVKRAEYYCLIYGSWNDTILLKTQARPTSSRAYSQKRRRFYHL
ncbi:fibronectin type III domain-containing protein 11 [Lepisosteus oculatus]|uniref:fibronectin type III domain-containing protein 11 n=1 Tax=Lepisosteus oculatus TaxID=7918 RepID=UPI0003EADC40|nr:PREDICTED: uncharacterized protein C20orf195 homolog [Lepisosteus oculatus]XP_015220151.1 PREDICTED: uncharacterized protein C20orf195 homolog [Lepisosteus oculatus]XP_015220152.1 PREDICTED: uncharacterized protein C20orf195 homolog [Lepisosteus oculatus]XP_015220153.1 PREDICTED: uncharacterized protein C20orf195 homolog [Lepisosteus oculatus]